MRVTREIEPQDDLPVRDVAGRFKAESLVERPWLAGAGLVARQQLRGAGGPARPVRGSGGLSPREIEVLRLLAAGESNGQIAAALGISSNTVERYVVNLYRKIDARGRADATAWAIRNGVA